MSDVDIVISVAEDTTSADGETSEAQNSTRTFLQQFPGHSLILSYSPYFKAQASILDPIVVQAWPVGRVRPLELCMTCLPCAVAIIAHQLNCASPRCHLVKSAGAAVDGNATVSGQQSDRGSKQYPTGKEADQHHTARHKV